MIKFFVYSLEYRLVHANPVVLDDDLNVGSHFPEQYTDFSGLPDKFDCVAEQILPNLQEQITVGITAHWI